jgi:hypothetical protein
MSDAGVDGFVSDASASDASVDAGPAAINGCTPADFAANDHTAPADSRIIQAPNDMTGSFTATVGAPDGSPDINTVIAHQPGSIAFKCSNHPAIMFGAVQVVP